MPRLSGCIVCLVLLTAGQVLAQSYREMVEADWLRQAQSAQATNFPTADFLHRARLLAADLKTAGVNTEPHEQALAAIAAELKALPADAAPQRQQELYLKTRWAMRRLAFSNPCLGFREMVFCKRFTQETYPDVCLNHMPWVSRPGGDLCVVALAGPEGEPQVRALLHGALGPGHIHGMDLWWDATRVVFAYAKSKSNEPVPGFPGRLGHQHRLDNEPTHIFEIGIDGKNLRQLTDHRLWSDLDPTYLPNGEIALVSERCGASLQCNEMDKDETSCNLYAMQPDGSRIRRLSVSKDGDYLPHCLDDGTIGYTRWEYEQRGWANIQSLWTVRPDGTGADAWFKQHLNDPWALEDFRSIPGTNNNKLVAIAAGHHTLAAGPVVIITPSDGLNDPRAIRIVTPGVHPPEGGMSGTPVDEGGVADRGGFYMTPWPLSQKCFLVSYSYSPAQTERAGYGLYLIDVFGTQGVALPRSGHLVFRAHSAAAAAAAAGGGRHDRSGEELRRVQPDGGGLWDAGGRARPGPLFAHPAGHPVALRREVRRPALRTRRQGRRELEPHPRDRHGAAGGRRQRALQGARGRGRLLPIAR